MVLGCVGHLMLGSSKTWTTLCKTYGRFVRRGRAARGDDSDWDIEISDMEDEELVSWLERPGTSMALQILQPQDQKKLVKYLAPGTVIELYQHYSATRQIIGAHISSSRPKLSTLLPSSMLTVVWSMSHAWTNHVRYSTFLRVYQERWSDVLKFRNKTLLHSCNSFYSTVLFSYCIFFWMLAIN